MKIKTVFITTFLLAFTLQGIAEAASISTRVRVLESKVSKHEKQLKSSVRSQNETEAKMAKSLAKMKALEKKMLKMLKDEKVKKQKGERTDKRYAFP